MKTPTKYPNASQLFHSLVKKGYEVTVSDYIDNNGDSRVYILTPHGTFISVLHFQWASDTAENGLFDAFSVNGVRLPNGEWCRGTKYCIEREDMLIKRALK